MISKLLNFKFNNFYVDNLSIKRTKIKNIGTSDFKVSKKLKSNL